MKICSEGVNPLRNRDFSRAKYRKVPIVATLVTFGISSLWGSLVSGGGGGGRGSLFSGNKTHETKLALALFSEMKI